MIEAADAVYDLGADRFYNDIEVCKISVLHNQSFNPVFGSIVRY